MTPNVVAGTCERCGAFKSRRDAMVAEVDGSEQFLCAECTEFSTSYFNLSKGERAEAYRWFMEATQ